MDIQHLSAFVTVAQTKNITRAAERLQISQPSASAQIKALETEIGTPLFTRNSSGMVLTHAGETLLPQAEALLQQKQRLEEFAQELGGQGMRRAAVGLPAAVSARRRTALVRALSHSGSTVQWSFKHCGSGETFEQLAARSLLAGFVAGSVSRRGMTAVPLGETAWAVVCRSAEADRWCADLPDSLAEALWLQEADNAAGAGRLPQWPHQAALARQFRCNSPADLLDWAAEGIGIAAVPEEEAEAALAQGRPLAVIGRLPPVPLHFVYLNENARDPALAEMLEAVGRVWPQAA